MYCECRESLLLQLGRAVFKWGPVLPQVGADMRLWCHRTEIRCRSSAPNMSEQQALAIGLVVGVALTTLFVMALGPFAALCFFWLAGLGLCVAELARRWRTALASVEFMPLLFAFVALVSGTALLAWSVLEVRL